MVCAEMKSAAPAPAPCTSVPCQLIWSPTSNGACWHGSMPVVGSFVGVGLVGSQLLWPATLLSWPDFGITNCVQYCPVGVALISPLPGGGTRPATLKLRHWVTAGIVAPFTVVAIRAGRFACGHSGSSPPATVGSVRGTHIGYPVPAWIVGFSSSTLNRESGLCLRPNRPFGSLICRTTGPLGVLTWRSPVP